LSDRCRLTRNQFLIYLSYFPQLKISKSCPGVV
jgi:hypothetical protein